MRNPIDHIPTLEFIEGFSFSAESKQWFSFATCYWIHESCLRSSWKCLHPCFCCWEVSVCSHLQFCRWNAFLWQIALMPFSPPKVNFTMLWKKSGKFFFSFFRENIFSKQNHFFLRFHTVYNVFLVLLFFWICRLDIGLGEGHGHIWQM